MGGGGEGGGGKLRPSFPLVLSEASKTILSRVCDKSHPSSTQQLCGWAKAKTAVSGQLVADLRLLQLELLSAHVYVLLQRGQIPLPAAATVPGRIQVTKSLDPLGKRRGVSNAG